MKVTVICDVLGKKNNGTTIAALNLIESLKEKGHEVKVACPSEEYAGIPGFFILPKRSFGVLDGYIEKHGVSLAKSDEVLLRKAIEGADIVHIMLPFAAGKKAARIARSEGIPVTAGFHFRSEILSAQLGMQRSGFLNRRIYLHYWNALYKYVECIHYPTSFIRRVFEENVGRKTAGRVISNGAGRTFSNYAAKAGGKREGSGKFTIISTGRYSKEKRQDLLVKAAGLSKHKDDLKIVLAGDGPLKQKYNNIAKKCGLEVEFGFLEREKLVEKLASADLYAHTAEVEVESIACLEAIAIGLVPIIADSPRSATREYALTENNLFSFGDERSLAEKIDFWYEHESLMEENRALYKGLAKKIDHDVCMDEMEKMLLSFARISSREDSAVKA